ncbi:hypothetical protein CAPTEDRAFT_51073, partial [Capitella teleta]
VALRSASISASVNGFIACVTSDLTYFNSKNGSVEGSFSFPMDDSSAVFRFEAVINDRVIIAECQEKEQAEQTYKDATKQGMTAVLLSERTGDSDIFHMKLGNLPAETEAKITIAYVQELSVDNEGVVALTIPTVLNPRY